MPDLVRAQDPPALPDAALDGSVGPSFAVESHEAFDGVGDL